jgi:nicotinate-nucleotide adenylyltransferase
VVTGNPEIRDTNKHPVRHIGIFGGTFDPPHLGHLLVAMHVRERLGLERIILVPSATSPHKRDRSLTAPGQRLAMVRLSVAGVPDMEVSDIEVRRGGVSYSVDTLLALQRENPGAALTLLIGMDNLPDFGTWRDPEGILRVARVVVMTRPGYQAPGTSDAYARLMQLCPVPEIEIASRDIRRRVSEGKSIHWMVTPEVEHYISQHGLYLLSPS